MGGKVRKGGVDPQAYPPPYAHMDWNLIAILAFAAAFQALSAAAWIVIGGLGGQWRINRMLVELRDETQRTDDRITSEIKKRAGKEGQEARQEAKSLAVQAAEHLAAAGSSYAAPAKPSTLSMINGGK